MPIINIPEKVCPHCNGTMWYARERKKIKGSVFTYSCVKYVKEKMSNWIKENPEKHKESIRKRNLKVKLHKEQNPVPRKKKTFKNHLPEETLEKLLLTAKANNTSLKVCKQCNQEKPISSFKMMIRKTGNIYVKPTCEKCYSKKHLEENRKRVNERSKYYYKNRTEEQRKKYNLWANEWRKNNPEKRKLVAIKCNKKRLTNPINHEKKKLCDRRYHDKIRDNLSDGYVASKVIGKHSYGILFKKDIPQELIELKRKQILLKRQIA